MNVETNVVDMGAAETGAPEHAVESGTWAARAVAWELLALSFRYPDAVLEDAVSSGEWMQAAREICAALDVSAPAFSERGPLSLDALRIEATRLFVGAPRPVCSPYEGIWRAADDGVQGLLFVNPHSMEVERFCKACGLGRLEGTNEPLDHVATECELMQYLACLAAGMAAPAGVPDAGSLPGGSPEAAYAEFLESHVRVWVPRFAELVIAESRLLFYADAAALLKGVAEGQ